MTKSLRLPPSASAAARAPGTDRTSKRLVGDREGGKGDRGPPSGRTWCETELARSRLRWTPRMRVCTGAADIAALTLAATGRMALPTSRLMVTVRGRLPAGPSGSLVALALATAGVAETP